jgi:hypothetical protein
LIHLKENNVKRLSDRPRSVRAPERRGERTDELVGLGGLERDGRGLAAVMADGHALQARFVNN